MQGRYTPLSRLATVNARQLRLKLTPRVHNEWEALGLILHANFRDLGPHDWSELEENYYATRLRALRSALVPPRIVR